MKEHQTIRGIWFIKPDQLQNLDTIINDELQVLSEEWELRVEHAIRAAQRKAKKERLLAEVTREQKKALLANVREEVRDSFTLVQSQEMTVSISGGRQKIAQTFADHLGDVELSDKRITGIRVTIVHDNVRSDLVFPSAPTYRFSLRKMRISTRSNDERGSGLHSILCQWAQDTRAQKAIEIWKTINPKPFLFGVLAIMLLALYALYTHNANVKHQARILVEQGINDQNQQKAIEMTLALLSDAKVNGVTPSWPNWFYFATGFIVIAMLVLRLHPDDTIGIGRGIKKLARQQRIIGNIQWFVITFLVLGVGSTIAADYLSRLFKRLFE